MKIKLLAAAILAMLTLGCNSTDEEPITTTPPAVSPPDVPDIIPPTNNELYKPVEQNGFFLAGAANFSSDTYNPNSMGCVTDHGHWTDSAGVVLPAVDGCDSNGHPIGTPQKLFPQVTKNAQQKEAFNKPVAAHRWWGSVSFHGEMRIGQGIAYITPDPILAKITERGARISAIPSGFKFINDKEFGFPIPAPTEEMFDGLAIGNSLHNNLEALVKDHSDASVTVEWQSPAGKAVMEATFVHGSPYAYFKAFEGNLEIRTLRANGGEKGVSYQKDNTLGLWTNVAGVKVDFLIVGEGETAFSDVDSDNITVANQANEFTFVFLPNSEKSIDEKVAFFAPKARNLVHKASVDYQVDRKTNRVTVTHTYLNANDKAVETIAGMFPMHWKRANSTVDAAYSARSARGIIKFNPVSTFSYTIPFVGVLPYMPTVAGDYDITKLKSMIANFVAKDKKEWNPYHDTYWAGKIYGKVSELIAIARSIDMDSEAQIMTDWLKAELEDWFTANTSGELDTTKYFVYDKTWNTLLGVKESFYSHQMLNDHHFHYGYFVRAASEICRTDAAWCSHDKYGAMVELLIRDYAAGRDDPLFPYMRHFDPANGFSWASGNVNFARGNNNESTSEAANAYGAMVLYGLITNNNELVERGMYLHASTSETYWQYWNNIDKYLGKSEEYNNFHPQYNKITTSILWGDGSVYSTWFSPLNAHILGIQGLPSNPLTLYISQYPDYMQDYVKLGLSDSSNQKPSGLAEGQWRDIWWNLWAMSNADEAIADYNTVPDYVEEEGSSKAHTYHWLHTWKNLGRMIAPKDAIRVNDPTSVVFDKNGVKTYVSYNYSNKPKTVTFSDGTKVTAQPNSFGVIVN